MTSIISNDLGTPISSQLYIIGSQITNILFPNISKLFPDMQYLSPKTEDEVYKFINDMARESIQAGSIPILLINGHGNEGLTHFSFPELRIKAEIISNYLKSIKMQDSRFRCQALINTCFSGAFDHTSVDASVTSTDSEHASRGNLIISALNEVLQKKKPFSLKDIYNLSHFTGDYVTQSNTVKSAMAWDYSHCTSKAIQESGVKISDCYSQCYGKHLDLQLQPVIPCKIMNEAVNKVEEDENIMSGSNLIIKLEELTGKTVSNDEFFSSMTLRQYRMGKNPVPS